MELDALLVEELAGNCNADPEPMRAPAWAKALVLASLAERELDGLGKGRP